jgi:dihydroorotase
MNLLIQNARVIDPVSPHRGSRVDLHLVDGRIERVGASLSAPNAETYDAAGACVSIGWIDIGAQVCDPGLEHREDLRSAAAAAAAGGFTGLGCQPNTLPPLHSKSEVRYIIEQTRSLPVDFFPIGALSLHCQGKEITEMIDMRVAGAVAFSDGQHALRDSGLMLRALQYVTAFGGVVINQPLDMAIAEDGHMHEGEVSVSLGLRGVPALAEEMMAMRDLEMLEYTGSRLHLANISSARTVALVAEAKARGLRVTCSAAALNLAYDHRALEDFDVLFKVRPVLRGPEDRQALLEGLREGIIDIVSANHTPLEVEAKKLEFPFAAFGAAGLETAFATCWTHLRQHLPLERLIDAFTRRPRELFQLEIPTIAEGRTANLTLFDPDQEWTVEARHLSSKSRNYPLLGKTLRGKVLAIVNREQSLFFSRT